MSHDESKEFNLQTYTASPVTRSSIPYKLPESSIGQAKREMFYIFWFESVGTFVMTYATYASEYIKFLTSLAITRSSLLGYTVYC